MSFFTDTPAYAGLPNLGTTFLSTKLSNHLIGAIRRQLPVIQTAINNGCAPELRLLLCPVGERFEALGTLETQRR